MPKFNSKNRTDLTREQIIAKFEDCKNPCRPSENPYKDGQAAEFDRVTLVDWISDKYGKGSYVALQFKNSDHCLSLSAFTKTAVDQDRKEYKNEGGIADILRKYDALCEDLVADIEKYFADHKEAKFVLTPYYIEQYGRIKKCTLTNII